MGSSADMAVKLAASLGVGLLPGAPGTYGSLLTAVAAGLWLGLGGGALDGPWFWGALAALTVAAIATSHLALKRRVFGVSEDPSAIVIDEAAGMLLAMWGLSTLDWRLATAFVAFRFFDIVKPPPVGWSQRLPGAWGVVIDDLLAGAYAVLVCRLLAEAMP